MNNWSQTFTSQERSSHVPAVLDVLFSRINLGFFADDEYCIEVLEHPQEMLHNSSQNSWKKVCTSLTTDCLHDVFRL